jgi:hypothetical protein
LGKSIHIPKDSLEHEVYNNQTVFLDDECLTPGELIKKQCELLCMFSTQRTYDTSKGGPVIPPTHITSTVNPLSNDVVIAPNNLIKGESGAESDIKQSSELTPRKPITTETSY